MRKFRALDAAAAFVMISLVESPVAAGTVSVAPAPVLGAGVGALALLGLGYYKLARRRKP